MEKKEEILRVRNLDISFETTAGVVNAVRGVNLTVNRGETVAIVGESGSGKSVSAKAIMGILAKNGTIDRGQITFSYYRNPEERVTREILQMKKEEIRRHINGKRIAMVFQDPMTSLNPLMPVGKQIMEGMIWHYHTPKEEAYEKALELMKLVGITDAEKRIKNYPHQLSGGMRQRIVIAIALACDPELLICDEPTTALDVTIQSKILELIQEIQKKRQLSVIYITHDLGVVAKVADYVNVMYAGKIVESGTRRGPGRRDVCRENRRDRDRRGNLLRPAPPVHMGTSLRDARSGNGRRTSLHNPGQPAKPASQGNGRCVCTAE